MNLTNAKSVTINNKTVERILINGKTVYNTIQMLLSTNKEHIKTDESAIVNIESNIKNKTIELWKVINMTRTSMGTQTTGSDGKASWTYTGAGAGEVQFIATYDDIESNTVTIEDYTPVIMRAVLTADKTTISTSESVTLTCNYFDQYNELTADYYSSALYDGSTSVEMGAWECPDVFTVSGLSVGTHSFKVCVTNHDSSIVDSNIVSVVVENSFDGMSLGLSAGSQILSYADEQSVPDSQFAAVTAQLLDGQSSATVSNVPVVFGAYQNDVLITGSEQTVNTDSNGQASYTYHSAGRGDVVVKAVPDNRTSLTKTYKVHDYVLSDNATSDKTSSHFSSGISLRNNGNASISFDSTNSYYNITQSTQGECFIPIPVLEGLDDFVLEYDAQTNYSSAHSVGFCVYPSSNNWGTIAKSVISWTIGKTVNGTYNYTTQTSSLSENTWYHFKITVTNDSVTVEIYQGDTLKTSQTQSYDSDWFTSSTKYGINHMWSSGRVTPLKNIKVKPL